MYPKESAFTQIREYNKTVAYIHTTRHSNSTYLYSVFCHLPTATYHKCFYSSLWATVNLKAAIFKKPVFQLWKETKKVGIGIGMRLRLRLE